MTKKGPPPRKNVCIITKKEKTNKYTVRTIDNINYTYVIKIETEFTKKNSEDK